MGQDAFCIQDDGSLILEGEKVDGNIKSDKNIAFAGILNGNLNSEGSVFLLETAAIDGEVNCNELFVDGLVVGDVCVATRTVMGANAEIRGKLTTESLRIVPGAVIGKGLRLRKRQIKK